MDSEARSVTLPESVDIPLPSEELELSLQETETLVEVQEIPQEVGYFSARYRRC